MSYAAASSAVANEQNLSLKLLCIAVMPKAHSDSFALYWLQYGDDVDQARLIEAARDVLSDPLQEDVWVAQPDERNEWMKKWANAGYKWWAERQFLPGVTDNLAHTVMEALAIKGLTGSFAVASGSGYLFKEVSADKTKLATAEDVEHYSCYTLFHPITDRYAVHDLARVADMRDALLVFPSVRLPEPPPVETVNLDVEDEELEQISRRRLLALNRAEMRAIRQYFKLTATKKERKARGLPESPTDVELEVIAQTWSEHCKHKIFNANITHTDYALPVTHQRQSIKSLYKTYIQAATKNIAKQRPDLLSVFEDNSGVVRWNEEWAVCFKVETHNSPSALEPYGGALTGILGVNRDVLGTGLGARPLFNTDVFCFAHPDSNLAVRPKLLPPKTILDGVRKGVQDGGNKSGIPTVNGGIFFHPLYRAKPLVFCGTGGILPTTVDGKEGYKKHTKVGDVIVMAGGRVGKDGIHGATFSSESLHEGSPVSAVQIGDPFTQKRLLDFVVEARDRGLITGITDNGAGGLSSSVGEMAGVTGGATIELDHVPTKYPGLSDWEIVVSESQERMTIATRDFETLERLAARHGVEISRIGEFHDRGYFEVTRGGKPVAMLDLAFLHDGVPTLELESEWRPSQITMNTGPAPADLNAILLQLLSHPNICNREQVIRQYDHEVQGLSVIKPLMGAKQQAPCDAAVILPMYGEQAGLVVSNGLAPRLSEQDCYLMAVCAVDEAVRNAVCVGADPATLTLLDNFCWPDPIATAQNPRGKLILAQLVRACQGLYDAVIAYGAPLISGKDSMKNDFDDGVVRLSIPPTLLVSAMGRVHEAEACISMEFKQENDLIYLISAGLPGIAASQYEELIGWQSPIVPSINLANAAQMYKQLHRAIVLGLVRSAHDLSDGGLAVALAECAIGSGLGASVNTDALTPLAVRDAQSYPAPPASQKVLYRVDTILFGEGPARIVVTIDPSRKREWDRLWSGLDCVPLGKVTAEPKLRIDHTTTGNSPETQSINIMVAELERAWSTPLPFD